MRVSQTVELANPRIYPETLVVYMVGLEFKPLKSGYERRGLGDALQISLTGKAKAISENTENAIVTKRVGRTIGAQLTPGFFRIDRSSSVKTRR
jgi:hypothetical protein